MNATHLELLKEIADLALWEECNPVEAMVDLQKRCKADLAEMTASLPPVKVVSGIFSGESGVLNKVVSSHPSGESLSQSVYFVQLKDGEVAFYKDEIEIK